MAECETPTGWGESGINMGVHVAELVLAYIDRSEPCGRLFGLDVYVIPWITSESWWTTVDDKLAMGPALWEKHHEKKPRTPDTRTPEGTV